MICAAKLLSHSVRHHNPSSIKCQGFVLISNWLPKRNAKLWRVKISRDRDAANTSRRAQVQRTCNHIRRGEGIVFTRQILFFTQPSKMFRWHTTMFQLHTRESEGNSISDYAEMKISLNIFFSFFFQLKIIHITKSNFCLCSFFSLLLNLNRFLPHFSFQHTQTSSQA